MPAPQVTSPPRSRSRLAVLVVVLCAHVLWAQPVRESDVEAAYLFNFGKFLREPVPSGPTFRIGILGNSPFGGTLQQIAANQSIDGLPMQVTHVSGAEEARSCNILFVSDSESSRIDRDLAMVEGAPVLTVSSMPDFLEHGGMIQFVVQSGRVRFEVNLDPVTHAHISLSSELLKVAVQVTGKQTAPGEQP